MCVYVYKYWEREYEAISRQLFKGEYCIDVNSLGWTWKKQK